MTTAMTFTIRTTALANGQRGFSGYVGMASDGAAKVLSGRPNSGRPLPNDQLVPCESLRMAPAGLVGSFTGPRERFDAGRSAWFMRGSCLHSTAKAATKRLSQRQRRTTAIGTAR